MQDGASPGSGFGRVAIQGFKQRLRGANLLPSALVGLVLGILPSISCTSHQALRETNLECMVWGLGGAADALQRWQDCGGVTGDGSLRPAEWLYDELEFDEYGLAAIHVEFTRVA